jgi:hypothetical protein
MEAQRWECELLVEGGQSLRVDLGGALIGRNPDCDIQGVHTLQSLVVERDSAASASPGSRAPSPVDADLAPTPLWRRWYVWGGGAVVAATTALVFHASGASARDKLSGILAAPTEHTYAEAEALRRQWRRGFLGERIAYATAGALAAIAGTLWIFELRTAPGDGPGLELATTGSPTDIGFALEGAW